VDSLQQVGEGIVIVDADRHRPFRKRTAKCGGDPGLVRKILNPDKSSVHRMFACGALVRFE